LHNIFFAIIGVFIYKRCYEQLHKYELTKNKKNDNNDNDNNNNDNNNNNTDDKSNDDNENKEYLVDSRNIQRLIAITLVLYPLNFFYYFLYYTDTMRYADANADANNVITI